METPTEFWPVIVQYLGPALIALLAALGATGLAHFASQRRESQLDRERRLLDASAGALHSLQDFMHAYQGLDAMDERKVFANKWADASEKTELQNELRQQLQSVELAHEDFIRHGSLVELYAPPAVGMFFNNLGQQMHFWIASADRFGVNLDEGRNVIEQLREQRQQLVSTIHEVTRSPSWWRRWKR